jgi:hypothetical protein
VIIPLSALLVAVAVAWGARLIAHELASRRGADGAQIAPLLTIFSVGITAAAEDPRALLVWQPMATAARKLFPAEFTTLDRAFGGTFPFTPEQIQTAHARWTSDWLAWEGTHDAECKLKAVAVEAELGDKTASPYGRARLEAVEREKLEQYQRRYEEYIRVSKALKALMKP